MAAINKLTPSGCNTNTSGKHSDGGGLYMNVTKTGTRSWVFVWKGKHWVTTDNKTGRREMGLGKYPAVTLAEARKIASYYRELIAQGIDPKIQRDADRQKVEPKTFGDIAHEYIDLKESGWRNPKHKAQWRMTVDTYCKDIKKKRIADINKEDVLSVINPLWETRHVTAKRVLGRIRNVLDYAIAKDLRLPPNPANWEGNIEHLVKELTSEQKQVKHHAMLDYASMPNFFEKLQTWDALAAKALTLLILTATRTKETLEAEWCEFDLEEAIWFLPPSRAKMGKEHAIPLPDYAIELLKHLYKYRTSDYVFQGQKEGRPLSDMSMLMLLRRHKIEGVTSHGMRATFRSWTHDLTNFDPMIGEQALAHSNPNKVEAAYLRSSAFQKRRQLMQAWCDYCQGKSSADVIDFSKAKNG